MLGVRIEWCVSLGRSVCFSRWWPSLSNKSYLTGCVSPECSLVSLSNLWYVFLYCVCVCSVIWFCMVVKKRLNYIECVGWPLAAHSFSYMYLWLENLILLTELVHECIGSPHGGRCRSCLPVLCWGWQNSCLLGGSSVWYELVVCLVHRKQRVKSRAFVEGSGKFIFLLTFASCFWVFGFPLSIEHVSSIGGSLPYPFLPSPFRLLKV